MVKTKKKEQQQTDKHVNAKLI